MSESIALNAFPESNVEGLAMLWVKKHADMAKTPQELCQMYWEAYYQIANANRSTSKTAREKFMD